MIYHTGFAIFSHFKLLLFQKSTRIILEMGRNWHLNIFQSMMFILSVLQKLQLSQHYARELKVRNSWSRDRMPALVCGRWHIVMQREDQLDTIIHCTTLPWPSPYLSTTQVYLFFLFLSRLIFHSWRERRLVLNPLAVQSCNIQHNFLTQMPRLPCYLDEVHKHTSFVPPTAA